MTKRIRLSGREGILCVFVLALAFAWGGVSGPPAGEAASPPPTGKYAGMILIPGGPFTMGRSGGAEDEGPAHKVTLPAFYIDRNLVTWKDYAAFINAKGPSGPNGEMYLDVGDSDNRILQGQDGKWAVEPGQENFPAGEMAWAGAVAYCKWKDKRLPSEAEWEKAARGTDARLYPWGNNPPTPDLAFITGYRNDAGPVGQHPRGASPYGVLDLAGQIGEWTRSLYRPYPYDPKDGRENIDAEGPRVTRGGNAASGPETLTSTSREAVYPGRLQSGHRYYGFRCAAKVQLVM